MPRRTRTAEPGAGQSARKRIVAGARRHFFAHGFRGVTMDDLAAELGMSKKTLYAQFRSKPELVEAAIRDKFADLEAELSEIETESLTDFPAALRELLLCVQRHSDEIQPPFVRDMQRSAPDLFKRVESRRAEIMQRHFGKLFANGRKAGMVRKDLPPQLAIEILLAAMQAIMNPRRLGELGLSPQVTFPAIISVILNGVLIPTGRKNR